jgi:5,10-methenyltetrahydromethanopterin hydrogenase
MTKENLRTMFQENAKRSEEAPAELREVINAINSMAYKLCGTMLVNCGDSSELTTAIRRIHEGSLCFQDALTKLAPEEANTQ